MVPGGRREVAAPGLGWPLRLVIDHGLDRYAEKSQF